MGLERAAVLRLEQLMDLGGKGPPRVRWATSVDLSSRGLAPAAPQGSSTWPWEGQLSFEEREGLGFACCRTFARGGGRAPQPRCFCLSKTRSCFLYYFQKWFTSEKCP